MLIQNFFSAVSYGVLDPESAKEKARLKQQEDNRRLGFPDRPVHGLPPRIPTGLDLVDAADARWAVDRLHLGGQVALILNLIHQGPGY